MGPVAPDDVELVHALRSQPGVDEAVVLLDAALNALVAYVSPAAVVTSDCDGGFTAAVAFARVASLSGAAAVLWRCQRIWCRRWWLEWWS